MRTQAEMLEECSKITHRLSEEVSTLTHLLSALRDSHAGCPAGVIESDASDVAPPSVLDRRPHDSSPTRPSRRRLPSSDSSFVEEVSDSTDSEHSSEEWMDETQADWVREAAFRGEVIISPPMPAKTPGRPPVAPLRVSAIQEASRPASLVDQELDNRNPRISRVASSRNGETQLKSAPLRREIVHPPLRVREVPEPIRPQGVLWTRIQVRKRWTVEETDYLLMAMERGDAFEDIARDLRCTVKQIKNHLKVMRKRERGQMSD